MESSKSDGEVLFGSSGGEERSKLIFQDGDVNMDDDQCDNFRGLDFQESESENVSGQLNDVMSMIVPEGLYAILEGERKRKKGTKKIKKTEFDRIIDTLQEYGERHGFDDYYLILIWELASSPTASLNCAQRRRMIFQMHPKQQVGHKVISTILYWLKEEKGCKPTVLTAVYQLLILYFENRLDDDNEIISANTINCILTARTENYIIPWKMKFFRNIVTPEILTLSCINALKKLFETSCIKKTQQEDIHATLGLCKHMRPDLFSDDDLPPWKMRVLNFPDDVCQRFYSTKLRIQNERPAHHPMKDKIFPEFLPDWNSSNARKTVLVDMLACLDSDEKTASLAMNPVLLHVFEEWLKPILNYRFHYFTGVNSTEDRARYLFILRKIEQITKVRQEGLKVINEWLVNFMCNWDFWMFEEITIGLLAFIPPQTVLRHGEMLGEKLLNQFRHYANLRVPIWKTLESWFFGWTEAESFDSFDDDGNESSLSIISIVESRKWLLKLMTQCVDVGMYTMDDSHEADIMMAHFKNFFNNLFLVDNQRDFIVTESRDPFLELISNLECIDQLSQSIPALELD